MEQLARSNKKSQGYSLIEVLAALLLLTIVLLALMQSVVLYTQTSMTNILRDEAVRATQDVLYGLRNQGFDNVRAAAGITDVTPTGTISITQKRKLRSTGWNFTTNVAVAQVDTQMLSASATTTWVFLGKTFSHQASSLIPNQDQK